MAFSTSAVPHSIKVYVAPAASLQGDTVKTPNNVMTLGESIVLEQFATVNTLLINWIVAGVSFQPGPTAD